MAVNTPGNVSNKSGRDSDKSEWVSQLSGKVFKMSGRISDRQEESQMYWKLPQFPMSGKCESPQD